MGAQNGGVTTNPSYIQPLQEVTVKHNKNLEEWRSWKIRYPYLALLILVGAAFILGIGALTVSSARNSGFIRESQPPGFLQRRPGWRKAIWENGIFYTAIPAFIMTIYRTMWDAAVMAFADRQPYVDLMERGGNNPERTILLDYKMEALLYRPFIALRNKHFLLGACMISSFFLTFGIVPLTSFLFTMDTSFTNSTFPLEVQTYFNASIKPTVPGLPTLPDVRLVLDAAAAWHLQNLSAPPRTDGVFVYPRFEPQKEMDSSNISVQTTAYGVDTRCVVIPESKYTTEIQSFGDSLLVDVHTIDRMCGVSVRLIVRTTVWSPDIWLTSSMAATCRETVGMTRMAFVAARYDKVSQSVQNLTFISCNPSYFTTMGTLSERLEPNLGPRLLGFEEDRDMREEMLWLRIGPLRLLLEKEIHGLRIVDVASTVDGNEFAKYAYRMSQQRGSLKPWKPEELAESVQSLYTTVFAVFAGLHLFKPLHPPFNTTGVYTVEEKRLFIVPVIAYIVLSILTATWFLNACLFWYARQKSMLKEEPFGLLSYAGMMYKSEINTVMMDNIVDANRDPATARESARKMYGLDKVRWVYDEGTGKITFRGSLPMQNLGTNGGNASTPGNGQNPPVPRRPWKRHIEQTMGILEHCGKVSIEKMRAAFRYCMQSVGAGGKNFRRWFAAKWVNWLR